MIVYRYFMLRNLSIEGCTSFTTIDSEYTPYFSEVEYIITNSTMTVTFPKPHYIDITEVEFFKAYTRGDSKNHSCKVERPSWTSPPYRCTITDLLPAKAYWVKSEACLVEANRCLSIEEETKWTLPSGELST